MLSQYQSEIRSLEEENARLKSKPAQRSMKLLNKNIEKKVNEVEQINSRLSKNKSIWFRRTTY